MSNASVRLARARDAGDDAELAARDRRRRATSGCARGALTMRMRSSSARAARARGVSSSCSGRPSSTARPLEAERDVVVAQRLGRCASVPWRFTSSGVPAATSSPPASPPSGPRSISQSAARIDVEVVLDDDQRVARLEQLAERAHQLGDVVEVQPGGRLVEHEERAASAPAPAGWRSSSAPPRPGSRRASGAAPRRPTASAPAGRASRSRGRRRRSAAAAAPPRGRRGTAAPPRRR